jgi:hypothetical protein
MLLFCLLLVSPGTEPSSAHADKQRSTLGVGNGRHFRGQGFRIANIGLELAGAVLTAGYLFLKDIESGHDFKIYVTSMIQD